MTTGSKRRGGFTLIELLVSIAILVVLMSIIFQIIQMTSQAWKQSSQGTSTMQQTRVAFERMTRNLSQATLNTYYSYFGSPPSAYMRQSELQFISGYGPVGGNPTTFITSAGQSAVQVTHAVFFQATLGDVSSSNATSYGNLGNLLNACGYFVIYGPDPSRPAIFNAGGTLVTHAPPNENRFRLMEYLQPSEYNSVYTNGAIPSTGTMPSWITNGLPTNLTTNWSSLTPPITVRSLANNIVALIIMPEQFSKGTTTNGEANTTPVNTPQGATSTTTPVTTYNYDSAYNVYAQTTDTSQQTLTGNQLPPLVKVVMVAIDEPSAIKLAAAYPAASSTSPPDLGNLYTSSSKLFQNPANLFSVGGVEGDLGKFEDILNATPGNLAGNTLKLNYYIFQTDVIIRGAKWTSF